VLPGVRGEGGGRGFWFWLLIDRIGEEGIEGKGNVGVRGAIRPSDLFEYLWLRGPMAGRTEQRDLKREEGVPPRGWMMLLLLLGWKFILGVEMEEVGVRFLPAVGNA